PCADPPELHSFPTRRSSDLVLDTEPAYQRWQAQTLEDQRRHDGSEGQEDDEIPLRERLVGRCQIRQGEGRGQRIGATHAGPCDQDRKSTRLNSSHRTISYAV